MSGAGAKKRPNVLPDRRISRCERIHIGGRTLFVHVGFDLDGTVREIFVDTKQATAEVAYMLADQAIALSYRLQYGARLADLEPRSEVMRAVLDRAVLIERECAADVIADYAAAGLVVTA